MCHPTLRSARLGLTLATLAVAVAGCSGSSGAPAHKREAAPSVHPAQPAEAFLAGVVSTEWLNQYPRVYSWLDPSQRAHIPEGRFMLYELALGAHSATTSFVSAVKLASRRELHDGLPVLAVKLRVTIARGADVRSSFVETLDAVNRGDHWTWLLPDRAFTRIANPAT